MALLIIFLIFIYRLKSRVKRLNMKLTLNERMEIVVLSGRQGWCMLLKSEIFVTLGQSCTSRAHRTVCEDVCSSACTRAYDATARPGM
jgi:hypothetical protein